MQQQQQQPTLAPAPHTHMSPQEAEQSLRAQLLPHIGSPQTTNTLGTISSSGPAVSSASPRAANANIDPAISGVGTGSSAPQQQQQQQQQHQQHQQHQQQQQQQQQHQQQQQQQHLQQQQQQSPHQQHQQQHPQQQQQQQQQPIQQPVQHVMPQQMPQQMQPQMQQMQMQRMPQQHPRSPGVQNIQMGTPPIMAQSMSMEHHSQQSQSGAEESEQPKPRGGKRELSTSKRAAQNRAAQRAFRQRKEGYIKKLEEQVRDFSAMQESYKQVQSENYQLRDYIIALQSRLIESQGEDALPPPPAVFIHPSAATLLLVDPNGNQGATQPVQHVLAPPAPQPGIGAPTASMGVQPGQPVLQLAQGIPINAPPPVHHSVNGEIAVAGHKRTHDDTDQAFLQSIAQAAGTTTTGGVFVPTPAAAPLPPPPPPPQQQQHNVRKSSSPAAKRVKGERVETKTETDGVNGA